MGQYGNQPDFATSDIKSITPNNTISQANFLDSSIIYIAQSGQEYSHRLQAAQYLSFPALTWGIYPTL